MLSSRRWKQGGLCSRCGRESSSLRARSWFPCTLARLPAHRRPHASSVVDAIRLAARRCDCSSSARSGVAPAGRRAGGGIFEDPRCAAGVTRGLAWRGWPLREWEKFALAKFYHANPEQPPPWTKQAHQGTELGQPWDLRIPDQEAAQLEAEAAGVAGEVSTQEANSRRKTARPVTSSVDTHRKAAICSVPFARAHPQRLPFTKRIDISSIHQEARKSWKD